MVVLEPDVHRDGRGFFLESYHRRRYAEHGTTAPMSKLVRCTAGSILDVAVDLRPGSPTFCRWVAAELTAENMHQVFVPVGFGHAFLTLSESADVEYKCGGYHAPATEGGVAWNDPDIGIRWPIDAPAFRAQP